MKSRIVAAILAFVFSFIGAHNFYLGKTGKGVLCILFCWTYIPTLLSFFDVIRFLVMSDADFNKEFNSLNPVLPHQSNSAPLQTTQAQNVTINLGSEFQKLQENMQNSSSKEKCYIEQIEALSELHKKGILTDEEFSQKKQDLLS